MPCNAYLRLLETVSKSTDFKNINVQYKVLVLEKILIILIFSFKKDILIYLRDHSGLKIALQDLNICTVKIFDAVNAEVYLNHIYLLGFVF